MLPFRVCRHNLSITVHTRLHIYLCGSIASSNVRVKNFVQPRSKRKMFITITHFVFTAHSVTLCSITWCFACSIFHFGPSSLCAMQLFSFCFLSVFVIFSLARARVRFILLYLHSFGLLTWCIYLSVYECRYSVAVVTFLLLSLHGFSICFACTTSML